VAKYDISAVKADARGHWAAIVERVGGVSDDFLTTTHGPCPKCNGGPTADRWRVFEDFPITGGAICNQCGKFGDGLAVIQWFTGLGFPVVLEKVATFLGTSPAGSSRGKGPATPAKPTPLTEQHREEPHEVDIDGMTTIEIFDHSEQSDGTIRMWCIHKRGISFDAVRLLGARVGRYRKRYRVIAFPVWNIVGHHIGWTIYESGNALLPQFKAGSSVPVAWLKVKTIKARDSE
jgi:hypothetical protein